MELKRLSMTCLNDIKMVGGVKKMVDGAKKGRQRQNG